MDHKWGRAILDKGLTGLGASMASRYLNPFLANHWVTNAIEGGMYLVAIVPADTQPDTPYIVFQGQTAIGHFPYGQLVEPDGP